MLSPTVLLCHLHHMLAGPWGWSQIVQVRFSLQLYDWWQSLNLSRPQLFPPVDGSNHSACLRHWTVGEKSH